MIINDNSNNYVDDTNINDYIIKNTDELLL